MSTTEDISDKPPRSGKAWDDEEVLRLLTSIRMKKSMEDIALEHKRTVGGIDSKRRKLAYEYFLEGRTMEEIQRFTGLNKEQLDETIKKYKQIYSLNVEKKKPKLISSISSSDSEIVSILKDINMKLDILIKKIV